MPIHFLQAAQGDGGFGMLIILAIIIIVFVFVGNKKKYLGGLVYGILFFLFFNGIKEGSFVALSTRFVLFEIGFILFFCLAFFLIYLRYKAIVQKKDKSYDDIKMRQKTITYIVFLFAFFFNAIPILIDSWGMNILPIIEEHHREAFSSYFNDYIYEGLKLSFLMTVAIFFADNLIHRIATDIYTYDDVKDIDNFCIYLRSFNSDNNKEEKLICSAVKKYFPIYAIGDPNSILQPNGADRIYVTDDSWKDAVKLLSQNSKFILIRVGGTEGTVWELHNIIECNLLEKTIFIIYNKPDFDFFADFIRKNTNLSVDETIHISDNPVAFYYKKELSGFAHTRIFKDKDAKGLVASFIDEHEDLKKEIYKRRVIKSHLIRNLFNNDIIPKPIRRSLDWRFISPLICMRHWPTFIWIIIIGLWLFGALQGVPFFLYLTSVLMLVFGNRIEWIVKGGSSASLFLKHQRREALYICLFTIIGFVYYIIYFILKYVGILYG